MPSESRIEYGGALYHVLNLANYRQELFDVEGAGASFEQTLYEVCGRFGWRVHAFVLIWIGGCGIRWFRAGLWARIGLCFCLKMGCDWLGKGLGDLGSDLRLAPWKVVLAGWIKQLFMEER